MGVLLSKKIFLSHLCVWICFLLQWILPGYPSSKSKFKCSDLEHPASSLKHQAHIRATEPLMGHSNPFQRDPRSTRAFWFCPWFPSSKFNLQNRLKHYDLEHSASILMLSVYLRATQHLMGDSNLNQRDPGSTRAFWLLPETFQAQNSTSKIDLGTLI